MNRAEKTATVEGMAEAFRQSAHLVLTDFRGLTANQANELRAKIRQAGGTYRVLKNRLAKRAAEGTAVAKLDHHLRGTCGLATHPTDPIAVARVLADFAKDNPQLTLTAAVVDGKDLVEGEAGVKRLASMPALPELRAQLLALLNTPATMLVRLLNTPGGQIARALDARRSKIEGGEG